MHNGGTISETQWHSQVQKDAVTQNMVQRTHFAHNNIQGASSTEDLSKKGLRNTLSMYIM